MLLIPYTAWEIFWYLKVGQDAIKPHTWAVGTITIIWILLAPVSVIDFIRKNILLGAVYVVLCILIGEVHPFTKVAMYDKFINYAYSFKLTDNKEQVIPLTGYFRITSGSISHKYFTVMQQRGLEYGFGKESDSTLKAVGAVLLQDVKSRKKTKPIPSDSLRLYLVYYSLEHDSIRQIERLMYADKSAE
jgi:hypothetical protein